MQAEHAFTEERARIVIIDDHSVNLTLLRYLLAREAACDPIVFDDPREGLAHCLEHTPDLVIVDYMMPEMSGIELIGHLRAHPPTSEVPVLMVTANNEREVRHAALDAGATDFLTKPIDNKELSSRTRNMLKLRRAARREADRAEWLSGEIRKATAAILAREHELVCRLSRAAEFRDPETGAHIQRMAHYSRLIARELGLSEDDQHMILAAAPMHDVGKIAIPDAILLKPGRLSEEEFAVMKQHARYGYELLLASDAPVLQAGAEIAHSHHEKFDGSGYPQGLAGEAIPLFGRIVAVADVFDALTSARPYKPAWSLADARTLLEDGCGSHFDPACVAAFLRAWDEVQVIRERFQDAPESARDRLALLLGGN
ncbi:HD domain-containing phosphohydrolase [Azoarcus olearius]|uniref:Probable response regulator n=1 Tax=Azoarcus sp. (strain BH72) TaxID=418699 RepID=A1KBU6_AZOSB|nr:HD domain-containing phosphohydrolase [Azoarcus olearius]ANQ86848.1 response regulator [Azoarcus olearius]CAL96302.1 probable response regulator [Azoarcus olearius]